LEVLCFESLTFSNYTFSDATLSDINFVAAKKSYRPTPKVEAEKNTFFGWSQIFEGKMFVRLNFFGGTFN
jgi:hypothetical protein